MRKLTLVLCIICLLIPVITMANQPCFPCLAAMLEEGILTEEDWQSIMSGDFNEESLITSIAEAEEIIPSDNYRLYLCYYLAYRALFDFIDCLIYYGSYDCRSAILYGLAYYYFCT